MQEKGYSRRRYLARGPHWVLRWHLPLCLTSREHARPSRAIHPPVLFRSQRRNGQISGMSRCVYLAGSKKISVVPLGVAPDPSPATRPHGSHPQLEPLVWPQQSPSKGRGWAGTCPLCLLHLCLPPSGLPPGSHHHQRRPQNGDLYTTRWTHVPPAVCVQISVDKGHGQHLYVGKTYKLGDSLLEGPFSASRKREVKYSHS